MRAPSAINRLSQAQARMHPPAIAGPLMAATVGFGNRNRRTRAVRQGIEEHLSAALVVVKDLAHVQSGGKDRALARSAPGRAPAGSCSLCVQVRG